MVKILKDNDYERLVANQKETTKQRRAKVEKLEAQIKELEAKIEKLKTTYERSAEKASQKHEDELLKKDRETEKLKAELEAFKGLNNDMLATKELEITLSTREKILKAKEEEFDSIAKELAQNRKKADEAREEGIKKGYADGLADGLREATKITAEDRKMMAQIAALAASSHTPDAATEIAKTVLKDVTNALPATTKKR